MRHRLVHLTPLTACRTQTAQSETDADSIGSVICREAERLNATLVVVGRHSERGRVKQLLLGSVANYCMHHCQVPTVVVPRHYYAHAS